MLAFLRGKALPIPQPAGELPPSLPPSCPATAAAAAQLGPGESSAVSCSSPQLVPPAAIWKDLPSRFGAKEQLAHTLLLRYPR